MTVKICVGSSCHLKGSHDIIELMKKSIDEYNLSEKVVLAGSFCIGRCSAEGVSVQIDDKIVTGVTREGFSEFFKKYILLQTEKEV